MLNELKNDISPIVSCDTFDDHGSIVKYIRPSFPIVFTGEYCDFTNLMEDDAIGLFTAIIKRHRDDIQNRARLDQKLPIFYEEVEDHLLDEGTDALYFEAMEAVAKPTEEMRRITYEKLLDLIVEAQAHILPNDDVITLKLDIFMYLYGDVFEKRTRFEGATSDNIHHVSVDENVRNPLLDRISRIIIRIIKNNTILRDKVSPLPMKDIVDKRIVAFFKWLKKHGLEKDIAIVGGGARDAYAGSFANDLDVNIRILVKDEELAQFSGTLTEGNRRIIQYTKAVLGRLIAALQHDAFCSERSIISIDHFMPPRFGKPQVMWDPGNSELGEIELQYCGPILIHNAGTHEDIFLKRNLLDQKTGALFSSNTGPKILQMGLAWNDANDSRSEDEWSLKFVGRISALAEFDDGVASIAGDGNNFDIGGVLRLLELKHTFNLQISQRDWDQMENTIMRYEAGDLALENIVLEKPIRKRIRTILRKARDIESAVRDISILRIDKLCEMNLRARKYFLNIEYRNKLDRRYQIVNKSA